MISNFLYNLILILFKEYKKRGFKGFVDYIIESGKNLVVFFVKDTDFFTFEENSKFNSIKLNGIILYKSTIFSLLSITYRVYFYTYLWIVVLIGLTSYLFYLYILNFMLLFILILFYFFLFLIFVVYRSNYIYKKYKFLVEQVSLKVIVIVIFFFFSQLFIMFYFYSLCFNSFVFSFFLDLEYNISYNLLNTIMNI